MQAEILEAFQPMTEKRQEKVSPYQLHHLGSPASGIQELSAPPNLKNKIDVQVIGTKNCVEFDSQTTDPIPSQEPPLRTDIVTHPFHFFKKKLRCMYYFHLYLMQKDGTLMSIDGQSPIVLYIINKRIAKGRHQLLHLVCLFIAGPWTLKNQLPQGFVGLASLGWLFRMKSNSLR
jgi:hypothetical protein